MLWRVSGLLLTGCLLIGLLWLSQRRSEPLHVSGFVEADEIRIGSRVGGRVLRAAVEEGQRLEPGQLLVELEPYDLLEQLKRAEAEQARAAAHLAQLEHGYRVEEIAEASARVRQAEARLLELRNGPRPQEREAAQAEVRLAEAELKLAEQLHDRAEGLLGQNAISREEYDQVSTRRTVARAQLEVKKESLALLREGSRAEEIAQAEALLSEAQAAHDLRVNGYRPEEIAVARAELTASRAAVAVIQASLRELKILAPLAGSLEAFDLQTGDLVSANAPVATMLDLSRLWIRAYIPENQLQVRLGQQVRVTVDSYPGEQFRGEITFLARDAEFTPRNIQTPEERSKQVFRVKVTLLEGQDRLRPGMSADVWLDAPPDASEGVSPASDPP